jgi:hypothetical protein
MNPLQLILLSNKLVGLINSLLAPNEASFLPETLKDWVDLLQGITTIVAIIAGIWLFYKKRQPFPKAKITHTVVSKIISQNKGLVRVTLNITNQGEVLLSTNEAWVGIQQIAPCPKEIEAEMVKDINSISRLEKSHEVAWTSLGHKKIQTMYKIEPSEDEEIYFDFVIESYIKTIIVYSYTRNLKMRNRDIGWNKTTIHDVFLKDNSKKLDMEEANA